MSQDSSPMYCCEAVTFVRIQPWFFAELFVSINPSQHLSFLKVISYGFTILTVLPQWIHHVNQTLLRCFYDVQCAIWTSFILDSWTAGLANLLAEKNVSDWKCFLNADWIEQQFLFRNQSWFLTKPRSCYGNWSVTRVTQKFAWHSSKVV